MVSTVCVSRGRPHTPTRRATIGIHSRTRTPSSAAWRHIINHTLPSHFHKKTHLTPGQPLPHVPILTYAAPYPKRPKRASRDATPCSLSDGRLLLDHGGDVVEQLA